MATCLCGTAADRMLYTQCPTCGSDLWDLPEPDSAAAPIRSPEADPAGPATRIDGPSGEASRSGSVVVAGHTTLDIPSGESLLLGRDEAYPASSVFARHTNISRMHGILRFDGTVFFITDSDSANGTFISGMRLEPQREYEIRSGQELRLAADVVLELRNN